MSQSAQRDPKLMIHSTKPAHTGLFAIKGTGSDRYNAVDPALIAYSQFSVRKNQSWPETAVNFPTKNRFDLLTPDGITIGYLAEHCGGDTGLIARLIRGLRRPFTATIWDHAFKPQILIRRPFYLFLSDMFFSTAEGGRLGSVHRRFSLFGVTSEVKDTKGRHFATISRAFFNNQSSVTDQRGETIGTITRTDDSASIELTAASAKLNDLQRAVLTAAAVSLDLCRQEKERNV